MAAKGIQGRVAAFKGIPASLGELGKLGLGALTHPETAGWIARTMLFAHMESMMVSDLKDLRDKCLPLFKALGEFSRREWPYLRSDFPAVGIREILPDNKQKLSALYIETWSALSQAADHFAEAKELADSISRWATQRHMLTEWFLDAVLMNLLGWHEDETRSAAVTWSYPGMLAGGETHRVGVEARRLHGLGTLDRVVPGPTVKPYNPSTQTREQHRSELDRALNYYYGLQEAIFTAAGFKPTIVKRVRTGKTPWLHLVWFIKYQMKQRSGSEIAEEHTETDVSAIHRAVREIAKTLDVTPRPQTKRRRQ